jgi:hypothetical protein
MLKSFDKMVKDMYSIPYRVVYLVNKNRVFSTLYFSLDEKIETKNLMFIQPKIENGEVIIIGHKEVSYYDLEHVRALMLKNEEEKKDIENKIKAESDIIKKSKILLGLDDSIKKAKDNLDVTFKDNIAAPLKLSPKTLLVNDLSPIELKKLQQINSFEKINKIKKGDLETMISTNWILIVGVLAIVAIGYLVLTGNMSIPFMNR